MFSRPIKIAEQKLLVRMIVGDASLGHRLKAALDTTGGYHVELMVGRLDELTARPPRVATTSLLVVTLEPNSPGDMAALENILRGPTTPPGTIVLADGLSNEAARGLLKLQIADWLSTRCTDREFIAACGQALKSAHASTMAQARCTTFVSAVGGAGATTLSLAAASVFARKDRAGLAQCCIVDLNFQSGALADYLDLTPNLQLAEIAARPERLDNQLLEVMLSRHASGLAILASPSSLTEYETIGPDLIGRLLDLASLQFQHLILDLPRLRIADCDNVTRGSDALYIVTDLTVAGLRQARRLADMLEQRSSSVTKGSVIVNKVAWLSRGGVSKNHALEVLGDRLGGFISHCGKLSLEAQNRGLLVSQIKKRNSIESELERILFKSVRGAKT